MTKVINPLKPIYNENSKVLILGSLPSVTSRKLNFYYSHHQNRFWRILESVFNEKMKDKKEFLLRNNIAMWDPIKSCEIKASSDASIKNIAVNDINSIVKKSNIKHIICAGSKSYEIYNKYLYKKVKIKAIKLPSTSGANAKFSLEDLIEEYKIIKEVLNQKN